MKRITKLFLITFCLLAYAACKPGIPGDVLPPKKMEQILVDIHLADGYLSMIPTPDSVKKAASIYYNGIYKKHGIDSASYNRSLNYYYKEPEVFEKIYTGVLAELEKRKKKIIEKVAK